MPIQLEGTVINRSPKHKLQIITPLTKLINREVLNNRPVKVSLNPITIPIGFIEESMNSVRSQQKTNFK